MNAEYVDLQVNGYGGVDFNAGDDLTADALHQSCQLMLDQGVAACLATIITDHLPTMCQRIQRLVALREKDRLATQVIVGLHIEGPFINSKRGYAGAHPVDGIQTPSVDSASRLIDAGAGLVRIVTLAPECDGGLAVTKAIVKRGIVVSAGHCEADLKTLTAAVEAGLSMYTHLGNGCPNELPRHDNIIQRVLSMSDRISIGFIADGVHVPLFALKNYLAASGLSRCFIVTDAMSAAGLGPGRYKIGRYETAVGDDCVVRSPDGSTLMGSAVTLARSATLLRNIGFNDSQIRDLMVNNPRRAIGMQI